MKGLLFQRAKTAGLPAGDSFTVGEPEDFRVPDGGYHSERPGTRYVKTAAIVLEALSTEVDWPR